MNAGWKKKADTISIFEETKGTIDRNLSAIRWLYVQERPEGDTEIVEGKKTKVVHFVSTISSRNTTNVFVLLLVDCPRAVTYKQIDRKTLLLRKLPAVKNKMHLFGCFCFTTCRKLRAMIASHDWCIFVFFILVERGIQKCIQGKNWTFRVALKRPYHTLCPYHQTLQKQ